MGAYSSAFVCNRVTCILQVYGPKLDSFNHTVIDLNRKGTVYTNDVTSIDYLEVTPETPFPLLTGHDAMKMIECCALNAIKVMIKYSIATFARVYRHPYDSLGQRLNFPDEPVKIHEIIWFKIYFQPYRTFDYWLQFILFSSPQLIILACS